MKRNSAQVSKPAADFRISGFPNDGRVWEVYGHGKVRACRRNTSEAEIEVFLVPLNFHPAFERGFPDADKRWIGVGQLKLLHIGSRWRNGAPVPPYGKNSNVSSHVIGLSSKVVIGPVSLLAHGGPVRAGMAGMGSYFDVKYRLANYGSVKALIPTTELIRSVFGGHSEILLNIFDGSDRTMLGRKFLKDNTGSFDELTGTAYFTARQKLTRYQAKIAGLLAADRNFYKFYNLVAQSLATSTFTEGALVTAPFPFSQPVEMRFLYDRVVHPVTSRQVSLVTHILEIGFPKLKAIEYEYEGSPSPVRVGGGGMGGGSRGSPRTLTLTTGQPPSSSKVAVTLELGSPALDQRIRVRGKLVEVLPPIERNTRHGGDPADEEGSTGDPRAGGGNARRVKITDLKNDGSSSGSIPDKIKILKLGIAKLADMGWTIEIVANAMLEEQFPVYALPSKVFPKFAFVAQATKQGNQFLIIDVSLEGSASHAVSICAPPPREDVDEDVRDEILSIIARGKGKRIAFENTRFDVARINHQSSRSKSACDTNIQTQAAHFALRLSHQLDKFSERRER